MLLDHEQPQRNIESRTFLEGLEMGFVGIGCLVNMPIRKRAISAFKITLTAIIVLPLTGGISRSLYLIID